jgi:hypothetical protein
MWGMASPLDLYRRQHRELRDAMKRLGATDRRSLAAPAGAGEARGRLADLSGKLLVHLQMEDGSLYPELLRSARAEVRATAARFQAEMGALRGVADDAFRRWLRPDAIQQAPDAFLAEQRSLLHALAARIDAEEAELYPLVERSR